MSVIGSSVAAGQAALARGNWEEAKAAFEAALATEETPEALEGLGLAAWWLDLADVVFDSRERAFRGYQDRGDRISAARVAVWLAWDTSAFRGEHAIATGWLQRARRLLDNQPLSPEHAWISLRAGIFALLDDGSPDEAEALAAEAIRVGRELGLAGYEVCGRALHGFSEVTAGRVTEGLRELDEVSASVLAGEVRDYVLMGLSCCYLIAGCERIRDYDRAAQWCDRLKASCKKWGLRPLFAVCRTQYASVCMWRGAWDEAERELSAATDELAATRPAMTGEGLARLGELRRRQGKLDEAMAMFDRSVSHPIASLGRAMVHFDRGDFKTAAELTDRYLRKLPPQNRTERAAALELLVRTELRLNNLVEARKALAELDDIAARAQTDPLRASASLAAGLVAAASGDPTAGRRHLEDAVDLFVGAPFEMARARVELARILGELGRTDAAADEARRAVEELTPLNADLEIARAKDVLNKITGARGAEGAMGAMGAEGARGAPGAKGAESLPRRSTSSAGAKAGAGGPAGLTARELEVLRLISTGLSNQAIAERLFISEHTVHRHVANTLTKLSVPSRSAAVAHAAKLGLL